MEGSLFVFVGKDNFNSIMLVANTLVEKMRMDFVISGFGEQSRDCLVKCIWRGKLGAKDLERLIGETLHS